MRPRERNKTLTCLAGAEPMAGINDPAMQRLQSYSVTTEYVPEPLTGQTRASGDLTA